MPAAVRLAGDGKEAKGVGVLTTRTRYSSKMYRQEGTFLNPGVITTISSNMVGVLTT